MSWIPESWTVDQSFGMKGPWPLSNELCQTHGWYLGSMTNIHRCLDTDTCELKPDISVEKQRNCLRSQSGHVLCSYRTNFHAILYYWTKSASPNRPNQPNHRGLVAVKKRKELGLLSLHFFGHGVYCVHTAIHINSGIYRFVTHVLMEYIHIFIIFDM